MCLLLKCDAQRKHRPGNPETRALVPVLQWASQLSSSIRSPLSKGWCICSGHLQKSEPGPGGLALNHAHLGLTADLGLPLAFSEAQGDTSKEKTLDPAPREFAIYWAKQKA